MMTSRLYTQTFPYLVLTALFHSAATALKGVQQLDEYHVPIFSVQDLEEGTRTDELRAILGSSGLISVVGSTQHRERLEELRNESLLGLCKCWGDEKGHLLRNANSLDSAVLLDGTKRTTLATATFGDEPLPLLQQELFDAGCSIETVQSMEDLRSQVAWISQRFVSAFDEILIGTQGYTTEKALLYTDKRQAFPTLKSIVQSSQNLEHFHVYEKLNHKNGVIEDNDVEVDVHTDAGLFLTFLPGKQCNNGSNTPGNESSNFYVMVEGSMKHAIFAPGSVAVMLGVGAENWLHSHFLKLRATRHAVHMEAGQSRAWYGMMYTVPQDAIVQSNPDRTFQDMRKYIADGMKSAEKISYIQDKVIMEDISIGCGSMQSDYPLLWTETRQLQTPTDASNCNNSTNFFCWMQCRDIPRVDEAASLIKKGNSLYCMNVDMYNSTSNAKDAYENCVPYDHNSKCKGLWIPTVTGIQAYPVIVEKDDTPSNRPISAPSSPTDPTTTSSPMSTPVSSPLAVTTTAPDSQAPCFSGSDTVVVQGKGETRMSDLTIGDMVLTGTDTYSTVYSFSHYFPQAKHEVLEIHATNMTKPLEISPLHMMYINGVLEPAANVKVGDSLRSHNEKQIQVQSVRTVLSKGIYAPLTNSGELVVNHIVASSYVVQPAFLGATYELQARIQHCAMTPYRVLYAIAGGCTNESYDTVNGLPMSIRILYPILTFLEKYSMVRVLVLWMLEHMTTFVVTVTVGYYVYNKYQPSMIENTLKL